jgi:hypothetical protein
MALNYHTSTGFLNFTNPYKHRYIAGSSKCSTKLLSLLLTDILTASKEKLQTYCATTYARSGVNQMWILKNSKELQANIRAQNFSQINNIKHTTFRPFTQPFLMINLNFDNCFFYKNGKRKIFISSDQSP